MSGNGLFDPTDVDEESILKISQGPELIVDIRADGTIGFGPKPDEAARKFWRILQHQILPRLASGYRQVMVAPHLERKVSMTMLRHYQACPRSGYLYSKYRGLGTSANLVRGSALHLALERALEAMVGQGEAMIPGDLMKSIVAEVLGELPVPISEHDYIRESAYRWAEEFTIDPSQVLAVEQLVVLELGGWNVRCKIDYAEARAGGMVVYVADWKSSRAAPAYEEIARRCPDGSLAGKGFQLILYALALAYGKPVRVASLECDACSGTGGHDDDLGLCPLCNGDGTVREEIVEPFPLAAGAERFDLELVFPGMERSDGTMVRREVSLSRLELGEYRESLIGLLNRLAASERDGDWPAILSDEACSECPAKNECPIPLELHDHAGLINTAQDAAEASLVVEREGDRLAALRKELKAWAKGHEDVEIRYGRDKAWRFVVSESTRIDDKDAMFDAVERARELGEPFDRSKFVRETVSTNFKPVTLTPEELEEAEGVD